jgi:hypothetical protein
MLSRWKNRYINIVSKPVHTDIDVQLQNALKIAQFMFPNAIIHWVFDNSSCHGSFAPDALNVTKMNVKPGGKKPALRETIIPLSNPHGHGGERQTLVFEPELPDDHPYKEFEGQPKGMRVVLEERGLGAGLVGDCKRCTQAKSRKPHLNDDEDGDDSEEEDERPETCCLRRMLAVQEDFKNEQSMLEKVSFTSCSDVITLTASPGDCCCARQHLSLPPEVPS